MRPVGVADGCRTRAFGSTIRRSAVELRPPRAGFLRWAGGNDPPRPRGVAFVHPGEASRPAGPVLHHPHPSSAFIVLPFPWMPKKESPRPASCAGGATCIAPLVRNRAPLPRARSNPPAAEHAVPPVLPASDSDTGTARHFHRRPTMIAARPIGARRSQPQCGRAGRGVDVRGLGEGHGHRGFDLRFMVDSAPPGTNKKEPRHDAAGPRNVVRGPALRTAKRLAIIGTRLPRPVSLNGPPAVVNPPS